MIYDVRTTLRKCRGNARNPPDWLQPFIGMEVDIDQAAVAGARDESYCSWDDDSQCAYRCHDDYDDDDDYTTTTATTRATTTTTTPTTASSRRTLAQGSTGHLFRSFSCVAKTMVFCGLPLEEREI